MKLLTAQQAAEVFGKDTAYFNRFIKVQPTFPKPIRITPKSRPQWRDIDLFQFIDKLEA